ncbi:MAG: type IX secretion system membrane protein PorP/SprF [Bacteroidota bacterium]
MKVKIAVQNSIYIYILALILSVGTAWAQDPQFSQYYANPIYTNPAFAGGSNVGRMVLNYRSQWPTISGTFRTFSASYDEHYDIINGGIGFIATADEAGVGTLQSTSFSGMYAYQINLNKTMTMRLGVQAGVFQKTINFNKLVFVDQIREQQGIVRATGEVPITNAIFYPNFSAGGIIYSNSFYAGAAIHNLNTPAQGFYKSSESKIQMRYTLHGGLVQPVKKHRDPKKASNLYPNVLYMQQGSNIQLNLGMYYNQGPIVYGAYFRQTLRNPDALILLLGIRTPKVKIGFSYDGTISDIRKAAGQSYEVSLSFELKKHVRSKKVRSIRCPEF